MKLSLPKGVLSVACFKRRAKRKKVNFFNICIYITLKFWVESGSWDIWLVWINMLEIEFVKYKRMETLSILWRVEFHIAFSGCLGASLFRGLLCSCSRTTNMTRTLKCSNLAWIWVHWSWKQTIPMILSCFLFKSSHFVKLLLHFYLF